MRAGEPVVTMELTESGPACEPANDQEDTMSISVTPTYEDYAGDLAENYERYFVPLVPAQLVDELLRLADVRPGERVVDVACGTGIAARLIASRAAAGVEVVGVDVAPPMLGHAAALATASGLSIDWRVGDAADLPLDDDAFDVAVCQLGLQFVADRQAAVGELRRVVKPGGRIAVNVAGEIQPVNAIFADLLATHIDPALAGFVRAVFSLHDPGELEGLLSTAGLRDVDVRVESRRFRLPPPAEYLWQYVASTPMSGPVGTAPAEARAALADAAIEAWQPYVDDVGGGMTLEQPIVWATATA